MFWVLVLLSPGQCGRPCRAQDASAKADASAIEPAKPGLVAVPMPALDGLEAVVAAQIREQRKAFETVATRAKVSDRDLSDAYSALGRLGHAYEFFDTAEASYANAIKLTPLDATVPHLLGYLYQQTGRFEDALARYSDARRLQPSDPVIRIRLADVYLRLDRLSDARALFQDLVEVYPAVARAGLGEIALRERTIQRGGPAPRGRARSRTGRRARPLLAGNGLSRPGPDRPGAIAPGAPRHGRIAAGRSRSSMRSRPCCAVSGPR